MTNEEFQALVLQKLEKLENLESSDVGELKAILKRIELKIDILNHRACAIDGEIDLLKMTK